MFASMCFRSSRQGFSGTSCYKQFLYLGKDVTLEFPVYDAAKSKAFDIFVFTQPKLLLKFGNNVLIHENGSQCIFVFPQKMS